MKEQAIQAKILKYLKSQGFVTAKVISGNRAGILDIVACSPDGRYWEIEVKTPQGVASKLQEVRLESLLANNAIAFIAYGYEDFLVKYNNATVIQAN